jgi:small subunit ribosomal protein S13
MRISGITLPDHKRMEIALTSVYGIGRPRALKLLAEANVSPDTHAKELTPEEEARLRELVENNSEFRIEGELRRTVSGHIKRLKDIVSYRGMRHSKRLPARGQRTKTNARTLKGTKKTMGSGKRKVDKK